MTDIVLEMKRTRGGPDPIRITLIAAFGKHILTTTHVLMLCLWMYWGELRSRRCFTSVGVHLLILDSSITWSRFFAAYVDLESSWIIWIWTLKGPPHALRIKILKMNQELSPSRDTSCLWIQLFARLSTGFPDVGSSFTKKWTQLLFDFGNLNAVNRKMIHN